MWRTGLISDDLILIRNGFWPRYDRTITKLVKKFGLKIFEQFHEGFILFERSRNEYAQQYVLPEGAVEKSFRFIGGLQSLIEAIAVTLPPEAVQNNKRVTSIHQERKRNHHT
jgi:monoamine oxidase